MVDDKEPFDWECRILGSDINEPWKIIGTISDKGYPGDSFPKEFSKWVPFNMRAFNFSIVPEKPISYRKYKVEVDAANVTKWNVTEFEFFEKQMQKNIGGPYEFTSAWMSECNKAEWVTIDLGTSCKFDSIILHWIRRARKGLIQVSDNGTNWKEALGLLIT